MKKIIVLIGIVLLLTACSVKKSTEKTVYKKSHNYNHKPYLKLKHKREFQRLENNG